MSQHISSGNQNPVLWKGVDVLNHWAMSNPWLSFSFVYGVHSCLSGVHSLVSVLYITFLAHSCHLKKGILLLVSCFWDRAYYVPLVCLAVTEPKEGTECFVWPRSRCTLCWPLLSSCGSKGVNHHPLLDLRGKRSCSPGCPWTCSVDDDDLELLITLLSLLSTGLSCVPLCSVYRVLCIKPRASWVREQ